MVLVAMAWSTGLKIVWKVDVALGGRYLCRSVLHTSLVFLLSPLRWCAMSNCSPLALFSLSAFSGPHIVCLS